MDLLELQREIRAGKGCRDCRIPAPSATLSNLHKQRRKLLRQLQEIDEVLKVQEQISTRLEELNIFSMGTYVQKQSPANNNGISTRSSARGSRKPNPSSAESESPSPEIPSKSRGGKVTQTPDQPKGYTNTSLPKDVLLAFQRLRNYIGDVVLEDSLQMVSPRLLEFHKQLVSHFLQTASSKNEAGKNVNENDPGFHSGEKTTAQVVKRQTFKQE